MPDNSICISSSEILYRNSGHIPTEWSINVSTEAGMIAPVRGMQIRLVIRKYKGNVLNRSQTSGAVVIWHAMDIDARFHILFKGLPDGKDSLRTE